MLSLPSKEVSETDEVKQGRQSLNQVDKFIKITVVLFILAVAAYGAYYGYTRYVLGTKTYESVEITKAKAAIIANPRDADARTRLGVLYMQLGRNDEALVQFDQALKVTKDHQEALLYSGLVYLNRNQYAQALKFFDKLIKYYRGTALAKTNTYLEQAYYYGGVTNWKKKSYDKALEYLDYALEIKTTSADTYLVKGRVYIDMNRYDEAIDTFNKALKFDPKYADAFYGLGLAYEKKGNKDEALKNYKAALASKTDFKMAADAIKRLGDKTGGT